MDQNVKVTNLDNLARALEKIADNTRSPFKEINERSRHQEIIKAQREQTEILKKQQEFNVILALATTVLAIGVFIEVIITFVNEGIDFSGLIKIHWIFGVLLIFGLTIFLTFMGSIVVLLLNLLFFKKQKEHN